MRSPRFLLAFLCTVALGSLACRADDVPRESGARLGSSPPRPADDPAADLVATTDDTTLAACPILLRNDFRQEVTAGNGNWGTWAACPERCPPGSFAYRLNVKS